MLFRYLLINMHKTKCWGMAHSSKEANKLGLPEKNKDHHETVLMKNILKLQHPSKIPTKVKKLLVKRIEYLKMYLQTLDQISCIIIYGSQDLFLN